MLEPDDRIAQLYSQAEQQAEAVFKPTIPINRYFRSLTTMDQIHKVKTDDKMYEHAYLIQVKMGILFLKFLKTHPEYAAFSKSNPNEVKRARKMCADGLSLAESVKNQLRNQFTEELKVFKIRQEREKAEEEARKAKEEMWKMEAERRRLEAESEAAQREIEEMNEENRRQEAEAERQELIRIYGDPDKILQEATAPPSTIPSSAPNVAPPPYTPRQEPLQSPYQPVNNNIPIVPPRHNKPATVSDQLKIIESPSIPSSLTKINIPISLSSQFLNVAKENNSRNIETCGILFGKLGGEFTITHCLIPKQKGTHDSCVTTNEEQILEFQDKNPELLMLGWIHTHPDYNAFLSSVDLHNHYLYQCMMVESIAIVVSPKFNETGAFILTEEGMKVIGSCQKSGFHPHQKQPPLFRAAPHVHYFHSGVSLVDWR